MRDLDITRTPTSSITLTDDDTGRFSEKDGIDLLATPILNLNPLNMVRISGEPLTIRRLKWIYFKTFALENLPSRLKDSLGQPLPALNKEENHPITKDLIDKFNTSPNSKWAINKAPIYEEDSVTTINSISIDGFLTVKDDSIFLGQKYPMTLKDIEAVQTFNKISDSRIIVDGWLGTQTFKLTYPLTRIYTPQFLPNFKENNPWRTTVNTSERNVKGYDVTSIPGQRARYGVIWGNKRYILPYKKFMLPQIFGEGAKNIVNIPASKWSATFRLEDLQPYSPSGDDRILWIVDPASHDDEKWNELAFYKSTISPEEINLATIQEKAKTNVAKIVNSISKNINGIG